jgi:hypothetical protein
MADKHPNHPHKEDEEKQEPSYVPASPVKRTLAWIALAYVLLLLALTTYFYYTGTMLGNLVPLLTLPGLIGLGALFLVSFRSTGSPSRRTAIIGALVCWALAAFTLPIAVVGLLSNFWR